MRVISSNTETHYRYDALGRRVSKATYERHASRAARSRTEFVWEGFRLLQEKVPQQGWRTYLYDAEQPYTPVACVTGQGTQRQVWYYHTDVTGTAQEVTSADGKRVWAGYLAAWGEKRADISNSGAYFHQPLRLPGQYFDDETGLHYNLFRYYAPESGRFISQDPIGLAGGLNLYQYAPNPLSWIDPLGLKCHGHHSDPKFMGGKKNQKLTMLDEVDHRQLHKDLNDFLVNKTGVNAKGETVHMRPQRGNSGPVIRDNFSRPERLDALAEFYKVPGAKYKDVAEDFFKQHPELK